MAFLYITELKNATNDNPNNPTPGVVVAKQRVAVGASTIASAAFNAATKRIRISCDVPCQVEFAAAATSTSTYLDVGVVEDWDVENGATVQVIQKQA